IGGRGTLTVNGQFIKFGGPDLFTIDPTVVSNGEIRVEEGTIAFQNEATGAGTVTTGSGPAVEFGNRGGGRRGNTATFTVDAGWSGNGTFGMILGTLELQQPLRVANFVQRGGTFRANAGLTVDSLLEWRAGTITGGGVLTVESDGRLLTTAPNAK